MSPEFEVQIQDCSGNWVRFGQYKFRGNAVFYAKQCPAARVIQISTGEVVS